MSDDEISSKKISEIINDKEAIKLISKNWIMRQEIRLLHRKIDKLERLVRKNQDDVMDKFDLKWNQVISLYVMEEIIFDKKAGIEIEEKLAESLSINEVDRNDGRQT